MTIAGKTGDSERFRPFEGLWLATKPSGALAFAKTINEKLLIPYSFGNEGKLSGHYYDCTVIKGRLFCRFEQFDSTLSGILVLDVAANETLKGGRWSNEHLPESVRGNISSVHSCPGMQPTVWVRVVRSEIPKWAEKYFSEDWADKA